MIDLARRYSEKNWKQISAETDVFENVLLIFFNLILNFKLFLVEPFCFFMHEKISRENSRKILQKVTSITNLSDK